MNKLLLAAICCMMAMGMQAREITYNVYYNQITTTRGELYQYAERYLGTTDVILSDSTYYELDKIRWVTGDAKNQTTSATIQSNSVSSTIKEQLPLSEETLLATNLAKKAESVAKQIYHIRETRLNILAGDVEHMPADGKAMQLVLDELNRQEVALTSMFVGKSVVTNLRQSVTVNISDTTLADKQTMFKFSTQEGMLESYASQGEPVTITVTRTTERVLAAQQPKKGEPVYENKIVSSKFIIMYLNKILYAQTVNL